MRDSSFEMSGGPSGIRTQDRRIKVTSSRFISAILALPSGTSRGGVSGLDIGAAAGAVDSGPAMGVLMPTTGPAVVVDAALGVDADLPFLGVN